MDTQEKGGIIGLSDPHISLIVTNCREEELIHKNVNISGNLLGVIY